MLNENSLHLCESSPVLLFPNFLSSLGSDAKETENKDDDFSISRKRAMSTPRQQVQAKTLNHINWEL